MSQITVFAAPFRMYWSLSTSRSARVVDNKALFSRVRTERGPALEGIGLIAVLTWLLSPEIYNAFAVFAWA